MDFFFFSFRQVCILDSNFRFLKFRQLDSLWNHDFHFNDTHLQKKQSKQWWNKNVFWNWLKLPLIQSLDVFFFSLGCTLQYLHSTLILSPHLPILDPPQQQVWSFSSLQLPPALSPAVFIFIKVHLRSVGLKVPPHTD